MSKLEINKYLCKIAEMVEDMEEEEEEGKESKKDEKEDKKEDKKEKKDKDKEEKDDKKESKKDEKEDDEDDEEQEKKANLYLDKLAFIVQTEGLEKLAGRLFDEKGNMIPDDGAGDKAMSVTGSVTGKGPRGPGASAKYGKGAWGKIGGSIRSAGKMLGSRNVTRFGTSVMTGKGYGRAGVIGAGVLGAGALASKAFGSNDKKNG